MSRPINSLSQKIIAYPESVVKEVDLYWHT